MTEFSYSATSEASLQSLLSVDRLQSYLSATGNSLSSALELYVWNSAVSGSLYGPLQAIEVALRNKIYSALTAQFGNNWPTNTAFLAIDQRFPDDIADAGEKIIRNWVRKNIPAGTPRTSYETVRQTLDTQARQAGAGVVTVPRIVAELSFGFWVSMFKSEYQYTLFGPVLSTILPKRTKRTTISGPLQQMKDLRNRIAHHEPIHHLNLKARYDELLAVAALLSADLRDWIVYHSRCHLLIEHKPKQRQLF